MLQVQNALIETEEAWLKSGNKKIKRWRREGWQWGWGLLTSGPNWSSTQSYVWIAAARWGGQNENKHDEQNKDDQMCTWSHSAHSDWHDTCPSTHLPADWQHVWGAKAINNKNELMRLNVSMQGKKAGSLLEVTRKAGSFYNLQLLLKGTRDEFGSYVKYGIAHFNKLTPSKWLQ